MVGNLDSDELRQKYLKLIKFATDVANYRMGGEEDLPSDLLVFHYCEGEWMLCRGTDTYVCRNALLSCGNAERYIKADI